MSAISSVRRNLYRRFDPDFLQWLGRTLGDDERDYLVCGDCDKEFRHTNNRQDCDVCGGTIYAHIPDSEGMVVRWRSWKYAQKWWPQRFYTWDADSTTVAWRWLGRDWRERPSERWLDV